MNKLKGQERRKILIGFERCSASINDIIYTKIKYGNIWVIKAHSEEPNEGEEEGR